MPTRRVRCLAATAHSWPGQLEDRLYNSRDAAPHGQYPRDQWKKLGYQVRRASKPCAYLIAEQTLTHLYDQNAVGPARRSVKGSLAWHYLVTHYKGDETRALARSVWVANRLVKIEPALKQEFYRLKDQFLELHEDCLEEGRVAREEKHSCWNCNGTGIYKSRWDEDECTGCDGTGIYRISILYEWRLVIGGTDYCYHSYTEPPRLSNTPGADRENYGRRFNDAELDELPSVPLGYYLPALRHRIEQMQEEALLTSSR